ncbi:MAG TPA: MauE/DoxX family redox-associated membrane protein [Fimbriiglobus sp.]|nr:MauE/DoxX family redox-associated membrane protein [Fimbriiglobus sp.]
MEIILEVRMGEEYHLCGLLARLVVVTRTMDSDSTIRRRFTRGVHAGLGLLLLAAAGMKLYGLNVSPFAQYGWFTAPWVQMAAVEWEIVLGLWLVSDAYRIGAWLAAVVTFAAFAGVSGYLGWIGQASCGCFGVIKASPWYAFGVDVAALALLAIARPDWRAARATPRAELLRMPTGFAGVLLGAGLILVAVTAAATWLYGSPAAALARLQGAPVYTPGYVDFGTARPGEVLEQNVSVTNWTEHEVRLIGGTSDCSCITTANLPLTIEPGETATVPVRLSLPDSAAGAFTRRAALLTDCDWLRTIGFTIGCRVE